MTGDILTSTVAAGDRYPTRRVCGATCVHAADGCSSTTLPFLAVQPYDYVFHAPVKGRWLGRALLEVFVREFAYAPHGDGAAGGSGSSCAVGLTAYTEELCDGTLSLEGREEECRAAGVHYRRALLALYRQHAVPGAGNDLVCDAQAATSSCPDREDTWPAARCWVATAMSSAAAVYTWLTEAAPQQLLLLRQKDTIVHRVSRHEGRIYDNDPIVVLRCDLTACASDAEDGNALLVVHKPAGLPVHPSGSYRKNSVTSILEDVFGGVDRERYTCIEHTAGEAGQENDVAFVSIVHRTYGFELIRVILQGTATTATTPISSCCMASYRGVSHTDWQGLQSLMQRPPSTPPRDSTVSRRKRARTAPLADALPIALKVFVVHRLDAATSGVLLFGLNASTARGVAAAIGYKMSIEGGSGGGAQVHRPEMLLAASPSNEVSACGCVKEYLALVQGRVDPVALAATQHHCTLLQSAAAATLRVVRPIGCLSSCASLYWCPGAVRQDRWEREEQSRQNDRWQCVADAESDGWEGRNGTATRHAELPRAALLAAKHARLRRLTRGKTWGDDSVVYPKSSAERSTQERNYESSLRAATSEIRVLAYNADADQSLLHCRLFTGRTHQLRVHLASLGHPIVYDVKYQALYDALRLECPAAGVLTAVPKDAAGTDDIERYYASDTACDLPHVSPTCPTQMGDLSGEKVVVGASRRVPGRGCLCPERICLHAWRYTLLGLPCEGTQTFQDDPPSWCRNFGVC